MEWSVSLCFSGHWGLLSPSTSILPLDMFQAAPASPTTRSQPMPLGTATWAPPPPYHLTTTAALSATQATLPAAQAQLAAISPQLAVLLRSSQMHCLHGAPHQAACSATLAVRVPAYLCTVWYILSGAIGPTAVQSSSSSMRGACLLMCAPIAMLGIGALAAVHARLYAQQEH